MKRGKRKFFTVSFLLVVFLVSNFFFLTHKAYAQLDDTGESNQNIMDYFDVVTVASGFMPSSPDRSNYLVSTIGSIVGLSMVSLGVIFLTLALYGGYLWMTAQGNQDNITKAMKIMRNGTIGVLIVSSAYIISSFVVKKALFATQQTSEETTERVTEQTGEDESLIEDIGDAVGNLFENSE